MSDRPTPRTNSAIMEIPSKFDSICVVPVELALDLERELGDALQERDEAREALSKIDEIFCDGEDTHDDWMKMGIIAKDYLKGLE